MKCHLQILILEQQKMDLLKDYLLKSPPSQQPIIPNKSTKKTHHQYEYFNFEYRKRSTSLADMYSAKLNQLPHFQINKKKERLASHTLSPIEAINNYRIEKTIDSLNEYTQQLQLTLINQYKPKKPQSFRPHKKKNIEPFTSPSEMASYETINEFISQDIKNGKHEKTLYETFLNNGTKTRDESLGLHAVKLPIVDRFDHHNHTKYESQFKGKIYPKEEIVPHHTKIKFHTHKRIIRENSKQSRDGSEIIPWNTPEQYQFD